MSSDGIFVIQIYFETLTPFFEWLIQVSGDGGDKEGGWLMEFSIYFERPTSFLGGGLVWKEIRVGL